MGGSSDWSSLVWRIPTTLKIVESGRGGSRLEKETTEKLEGAVQFLQQREILETSQLTLNVHSGC